MHVLSTNRECEVLRFVISAGEGEEADAGSTTPGRKSRRRATATARIENFFSSPLLLSHLIQKLNVHCTVRL
jgi:hypothetical protein